MGRDWLAVAPAPYLYAAESADAPLPSATAADLQALRTAYQQQHAAEFPAGLDEDDWVQLLGAAYRRRIICLHFQSTPEQDARLIEWLNGSRNRSHFNFFFNNCADFTRQALNHLFPGAVHRNLFFDAGMTTPKQLASSLHHYAGKHPELQFEVEDLRQVPGTIPRSGHLYGVTQSFVRTKPYLMPLAILQPVGLGAVIVSGFADHRYDPHATADSAPDLATAELSRLPPRLWPRHNNSMASYVSLAEIAAAAERIAGTAVVTPLVPLTGTNIWFKCESAQPIGSFKLRGAYNTCAQLTAEQLSKGVITYSSGNHAQGVAYAAAGAGVESGHRDAG